MLRRPLQGTCPMRNSASVTGWSWRKGARATAGCGQAQKACSNRHGKSALSGQREPRAKQFVPEAVSALRLPIADQRQRQGQILSNLPVSQNKTETRDEDLPGQGKSQICVFFFWCDSSLMCTCRVEASTSHSDVTV